MKFTCEFTEQAFDMSRLPEEFSGSKVRVWKGKNDTEIILWLDSPDEALRKIFNGRNIGQVNDILIEGLRSNRIIQKKENWNNVACNSTTEEFVEKCKGLDVKKTYTVTLHVHQHLLRF